MEQTTALVVHFNDLRLIDHRPLTHAHRAHDLVYAMVVIDPSIFNDRAFGHARMSSRRLTWYLSAIKDLRERYRLRGGDLIVRVGTTATEIHKTAIEVNACAIYGQQAKTEEEIRARQAIEHALSGITCHWIWNDVLIDPELLPTPPFSFPRSFTGFRKKFEQRCEVPLPLDSPTGFVRSVIDHGEVPSALDLGFAPQPIDPRSSIADLQAGATGAWQQIEEYMWAGDHLKSYKETRNGMIESSDSSKLSPFLALGLISPRSVYHQIVKYEQARVENLSTYWLKFELLWREYFHALGLFCGTKLFLRSGVRDRTMPWSEDHAQFDQWKNGQTGCPIVDACMRELAHTGYSSNRARQIAASFLVRYLGIDWRWGAAWFEHHLIDYDPCSNWGNWQYLAGVGTDSRDRVFGMRRQAEHYDGNAAFVKRWLPEYVDDTPSDILRLNPSHSDDM